MPNTEHLPDVSIRDCMTEAQAMRAIGVASNAMALARARGRDHVSGLRPIGRLGHAYVYDRRDVERTARARGVQS